MTERGTPVQATEQAGGDLGVELTHYRLGAVDLYHHDWAEGTRLYKSAGETRSVNEMADHDGPVVLDGHFRRMIDDGTVVEQHPHAGYCGAWGHDEQTDTPAILLTEVEQVDD